MHMHPYAHIGTQMSIIIIIESYTQYNGKKIKNTKIQEKNA